MKRTLLLFVLFILCRMAFAQSPVASLAGFHYHNTVLPSMDLTYRYPKSCSDTAVLKATVYNRVARYTVVWQNGVVGDSIYVNKPGSYIAVLKNPVGVVVDRDTIVVPPQQDLQPTIEIHRSAVRNNDTLFAFPQQPPSSIQYFYKWYRDIWEVAAGNYPMLINPQPGTYKVYVRSMAGCSGYSDTVQFTRTNGWSLDAHIGGVSACGDSVLLMTSVIAPDSNHTITWNTGQQTASVYVITSGKYFATLKDLQGNVKAVDSVEVEVKPFKPKLELHSSVIPGNDTLIVYPNGDSAYYYTWYKNGIYLRSGLAPVLIDPAPGLYQVYASNGRGCNVATDTVRYEKNDSSLHVDFSYQIAPCNPQLIKFVGIADTQDSATYRWNFGDGGELINLDVWHHFAPGTYNVTLTVTTSSGQTGSISKALAIGTFDSTSWITNIVQQRNQCGDTVWLTASNNAGGAYYFWNTGAQTKTIAVTASGSYVVRVYDTCYNARGYDSVTVIVNAPCLPADTIHTLAGPTVWHDAANYYWNGDSTYIDFFATLPYPYEDVKSFSWSSNSGDLRAVADRYPYVAMFSFGTPGAHTVTFTTTMKDSVSGQYSDTSTTYAFTIRESYVQNNSWNMKDTTITAGDTLTLHAGNPGGTYFWSNSNGDPSSREEMIKITKAGSYGLSLQRDGDLGANWINVFVKDSLGLSALSMANSVSGKETLGTNKVKAFPNPSEGQVSLQFEKPLQKAVVIKVYNLNGRVMYNRTTTQQLQSLDLSRLPKGYYLIELTGDGQKKVLSLILQ